MINPYELIDTRLQRIEEAINRLTHLKEAPPKTAEEIYKTTDETAEKLSVSRVTLWQWDKKGILRSVRIGNLKRYRLSDIEKMMNDR